MSKVQREGSMGWLGNLSDSGKSEAIMVAYLAAEFRKGYWEGRCLYVPEYIE